MINEELSSPQIKDLAFIACRKYVEKYYTITENKKDKILTNEFREQLFSSEFYINPHFKDISFINPKKDGVVESGIKMNFIDVKIKGNYI